jgi:fucose permease
MPIAGKLTDRTGIGRIVPVGLAIVGVAFLGLTQLGAGTSYWLFGATLFVLGLGMGATMMPTFSGAMQTLRRAAVAKASTTLNINQQVGASIGTAVLSVLLAHQLTSRLSGSGGGGGGIGATLPPGVRERLAPAMADAFGATFWWALALVVVAFVVAILLLPKDKPEPVDDPDAPAAEDAEAPVALMH